MRKVFVEDNSIESGVELYHNSTDPEMNTKLTLLLEKQQLIEFNKCINSASPEQINETNYLNETPLVVAIRKGYKDIARKLMQVKGINLHIQSYLTGTPLVTAIFYKQSDIAKELIECEKKFKDTEHPGVLSVATRSNDFEIIKLLLKKGADINGTGEKGFIDPPEWVEEEPYPSAFQYSGPAVFNMPIFVAYDNQNYRLAFNLLLLSLKDIKLDKKDASNRTLKDILPRIVRELQKKRKKIMIEKGKLGKIFVSSSYLRTNNYLPSAEAYRISKNSKSYFHGSLIQQLSLESPKFIVEYYDNEKQVSNLNKVLISDIINGELNKSIIVSLTKGSESVEEINIRINIDKCKADYPFIKKVRKLYNEVYRSLALNLRYAQSNNITETVTKGYIEYIREQYNQKDQLEYEKEWTQINKEYDEIDHKYQNLKKKYKIYLEKPETRKKENVTKLIKDFGALKSNNSLLKEMFGIFEGSKNIKLKAKESKTKKRHKKIKQGKYSEEQIIKTLGMNLN